jgi:hypothetical protein
MDIGYQGLSVRPGVHMALMYHDTRQAMSVVARILATGLKQGDGCLFCGSSENAKTLRACLVAEGIDPEKAVENNSLRMLTEKNELLTDGKFNPDTLTALLHGFIKQALDIDDRPARVVVDLSWLTSGVPDSQRILEYEHKTQELFSIPDVRVLGLCLYAISKLNSDDLFALLQCHPIAIVGENLRINPHHNQGPDSEA